MMSKWLTIRHGPSESASCKNNLLGGYIRVSTLTINGVRIHYIMRGEGTPIIFVHPPVLSSTSFMPQIRALSDHYTTIALDIRGHGKSQASERPLTYSLITADIHELMNQLNIEKAFLCGYSTGATVVLDFLLAHPERAYGGILVGGMSEVHDLRLKVRIAMGIVLTKLGAIQPLALGITWSNSQPRLFWETFLDAKQGNSKNVEQYYRCSLSYNCTNQLSGIRVPMLLIYGERDKGFHSYARQIHQRVPQSELLFIPNVKHQIPSKAVVPFHQALTRFISRHSQAHNSHME